MDHHRTPSTSWRSALVAIDVFVGPYPALIPADRDLQAMLTPRFSLRVVERIQQATLALADGNGPIVLLTGRQVTLTTIRQHMPQPGGRKISSDADGRYAIDAPFGQWQEANDPLEHSDICDCGDCGCPDDCAACESPVGTAHHRSCPWQGGSATWERPRIPAARVVLEAHTHRPGCPWVRRRPGPLFLPGRGMCLYCGTLGEGSTHDVIGPDGLAHHQYCRDCRQHWSSAAI